LGKLHLFAGLEGDKDNVAENYVVGFYEAVCLLLK
jgi:hypothetical protein